MTFLGASNRFRSFDISLVMLWSAMNGDEVQNLYHFLTPINFIIAVIFCYSWVWIGNNIITNAFLAMMEDGYITQK